MTNRDYNFFHKILTSIQAKQIQNNITRMTELASLLETNSPSPPRSTSRLNTSQQRPYTSYGDTTNRKKIISSFELKRHFSHKSIYSSKFTNNIVGRRSRTDFENGARSKSTLNYYRAYTSHSFLKSQSPNQSEHLLSEEESEEGECFGRRVFFKYLYICVFV